MWSIETLAVKKMWRNIMVKIRIDIPYEAKLASSFKYSSFNPLRIVFAANNKPKNQSKRYLK